jgi:hypothetical protein
MPNSAATLGAAFTVTGGGGGGGGGGDPEGPIDPPIGEEQVGV